MIHRASCRRCRTRGTLCQTSNLWFVLGCSSSFRHETNACNHTGLLQKLVTKPFYIDESVGLFFFCFFLI